MFISFQVKALIIGVAINFPAVFHCRDFFPFYGCLLPTFCSLHSESSGSFASISSSGSVPFAAHYQWLLHYSWHQFSFCLINCVINVSMVDALAFFWAFIYWKISQVATSISSCFSVTFLHFHIPPALLTASNVSYSQRTTFWIIFDLIQIGNAYLPRPATSFCFPWTRIELGANVHFYWTRFLPGWIVLLNSWCSWSMAPHILLCLMVHRSSSKFYWCQRSLTPLLSSLGGKIFQWLFCCWIPSPCNHWLLWRLNPLLLEWLRHIHHAHKCLPFVLLLLLLAPWDHPKRRLDNVKDGPESLIWLPLPTLWHILLLDNDSCVAPPPPPPYLSGLGHL